MRYRKRQGINDPMDMAYDDPEDLTPSERLERVTSILSAGVLRLIEEEKSKDIVVKEDM